jgi:hypothetical protein
LFRYLIKDKYACILGTSDIQGYCCGLYPGRVETTELFTEEFVQRSDAGEL